MLVKQINSKATRNIEKNIPIDKIIRINSFGSRNIMIDSAAKTIIEKESEVESDEI